MMRDWEKKKKIRQKDHFEGNQTCYRSVGGGVEASHFIIKGRRDAWGGKGKREKIN